MRYTIIRPKDEHRRDLAFLGLAEIGVPDLDKYAPVYSGMIDSDADDETILEGLFEIFNLYHPSDFKNYSMSVGDLVRLDDDRLWFCDRVGWRRV